VEEGREKRMEGDRQEIEDVGVRKIGGGGEQG